VNQADEIEIFRHGREMAANSVQGKEECAVGHEHENAIQAPCANTGFSVNGNNPLRQCLSLEELT
jgi:hypothetical protein